MCESFFKTPSVVIKSLTNGVGFDASYFRPARNRSGFSVENEHSVSSSVSRLLFARCPSAVFGRVGSVVVPSFNSSASKGTWTHIRQKVFKSVPATANPYSSTGIPLELRVTLMTSTTCHHAAPYLVFRCSGHSVSQVMWNILTKTSTTTSLSTNQTPGPDGFILPAITSAVPHHSSIFAFLRRNIESQKSAKTHPGKVFGGDNHNVADNTPTSVGSNP